jgi:hypothetical protein
VTVDIMLGDSAAMTSASSRRPMTEVGVSVKVKTIGELSLAMCLVKATTSQKKTKISIR